MADNPEKGPESPSDELEPASGSPESLDVFQGAEETVMALMKIPDIFDDLYLNYGKQVNALFSEKTITAINEVIRKGNMPHRTVTGRAHIQGPSMMHTLTGRDADEEK